MCMRYGEVVIILISLFTYRINHPPSFWLASRGCPRFLSLKHNAERNTLARVESLRLLWCRDPDSHCFRLVHRYSWSCGSTPAWSIGVATRCPSMFMYLLVLKSVK